MYAEACVSNYASSASCLLAFNSWFAIEVFFDKVLEGSTEGSMKEASLPVWPRHFHTVFLECSSRGLCVLRLFDMSILSFRGYEPELKKANAQANIAVDL